jgi:hypothetical protein
LASALKASKGAAKAAFCKAPSTEIVDKSGPSGAGGALAVFRRVRAARLNSASIHGPLPLKPAAQRRSVNKRAGGQANPPIYKINNRYADSKKH